VTGLTKGKWDGNSKTLLLRIKKTAVDDDDVTEEKSSIYLLTFFMNNTSAGYCNQQEPQILNTSLKRRMMFLI
jgi:hypothetical protein